jgi:hypothetical protein
MASFQRHNVPTDIGYAQHPAFFRSSQQCIAKLQGFRKVTATISFYEDFLFLKYPE